MLRDEADFERHVEYIYYNPVKQGYVASPLEWPHTSFLRYADGGVNEAGWGQGQMDFEDVEYASGNVGLRYANPTYRAASAGGESIFGWAVWEWPKVFIEAEFRAVWKQTDGSFLDIAPKSFPTPRILFVPGTRCVYRGRQIDNMRLPLCNDKAVKSLCGLSALIFKELNASALADVHGEVIVTEKERVLHTLQRRYGINYPEHFTGVYA